MFRQGLRQLDLMIVDVFSLGRATRHDNRKPPRFHGVYDGTGTGVQDQQLGVLHGLQKLFHAQKGYRLAATVGERRVSMLNDHGLGKLYGETADALEQARKRLERVTDGNESAQISGPPYSPLGKTRDSDSH